MGLISKTLILCIACVGFFNSSTKGAYVQDNLSSEYTPSNRKCEESAFLPEPPCCGISEKHLGRIFGGKLVELGEFPWVVIIYPYGTNNIFGGGSLINSRWVLTAGHNIKDHVSDALEVHLGEWNRKTELDCVKNVCAPPIKKYKVDNRIIHEKYDNIGNTDVAIHDIALLHLAESVIFTDYIKPICLPLGTAKQHNFANKMAVVAGWGQTESKSPSDVMLKASVKIWDSLSCQQHAFNASIQTCAGGAEGIGACAGDSGGPLMLPSADDVYYQVGVVSYGSGCGMANIPTIYVNVASYVQWIKDTIFNNQ